MKLHTAVIAALALCCGACSSDSKNDEPLNPVEPPKHNYPELIEVTDEWKAYHPGNVSFRIESPNTAGAKIYKTIVPAPDTYIKDNARRVLQTLYYS
ncbi:MAG: hypothetical protein K2L69_00205, partial [Muribaculaceae bacterium]|nr:hypothetical protein [Muribaculaceae bacterium]